MEHRTSLSQVSTLLNSLCGQATVLDATGQILLVNDEWQRFGADNGWRDTRFGVGSNYLDVCKRAAGEDACGAQDLRLGLQDVIDHRRDAFLHAYPCHSATENRWFQCQITRIPATAAGSEFLVLVQHVDITEQVSQLTDRTVALKLANDAMQQFIYVVSHDLREPLRAIVGFSGLAESRYGERLPKQGREFLGHIKHGGERLSSLLDGLLEYVTATEVQDKLRAFDLNDVLASVCEDLANTISRAEAKIEGGPLPVVLGYPVMVQQVLTNLIDNAIKYRSERPPRIKVSATEARAEWCIAVEDNGIGISPDHAKNVFKIFQRLHRDDEVPGTGVGLAICKKIVDIHHGQLWIDDKTDGGTRFCFTLAKKALQ